MNAQLVAYVANILLEVLVFFDLSLSVDELDDLRICDIDLELLSPPIAGHLLQLLDCLLYWITLGRESFLLKEHYHAQLAF